MVPVCISTQGDYVTQKLEIVCLLIWAVLCGSLPCSAQLDVGQNAPDIEAPKWFNTVAPVALRRGSNDVAVVEFWASWCGPCRYSIPHLNTLHAELKKRGVSVVGLTDEAPSVVSSFMLETPMDYPVGAGSRASSDYGVESLPTAFVVKGGRIVWRGHPMQNLDIAIERAIGGIFTPTNAAAVVGEGLITIPEFQSFLKKTMGNANLKDAPDVSKYRLLDFLVQSQLLETRLRAASLSVHANQVNQRYAEEEAAFEAEKENVGTSFESFLLKNNVSRALRLEMLRMDLAVEALVKQNFSDVAMKAAYEKSPETFHRAHVQHIMMGVEDWSDAEAAEAVRDKVVGIRERLLEGADFATQARVHSTGQRADRGGDLGWLGKGGKSALDMAMFSTPIGGVSDVISTKSGFHIIKVLDKKVTFETLEDDIRDEIMHGQKMELIQTLSDGVAVRRNHTL
ncbi:MAG: parvulin-like peptidyl-prolyl isomerase/peroxiredoxin [Candidatus Promineifilaceae bacterium]|jgi:parvulin-like peptidyl-prolyl isomerase/peroxiredoxin